jgi:predicted phosphodiesterase
MKIKLLSDLHLEFEYYKISYNNEDILILAGDIHTDSNLCLEFIKKHLNEYKKLIIIYVLGNHDYYGHTIKETDSFWESVKLDRFYYLQNDSIVFNGIRFFGSTLWTDMDEYNPTLTLNATESINDYRKIKGEDGNKFKPSDSYIIHYRSKGKMVKCLDESKEPVVIITHHLPSYKSIAEKYKNFKLNGSFASHLDDLVKKAHMWFHGHTHTSLDYYIGDCRVICNPRGYHINSKTENENFNSDLLISIENH